MKYTKWELEQLADIRKKSHKFLLDRGWTEEKIAARDLEIKEDLDAIDKRFIIHQRIMMVKTFFILLAVILVYMSMVIGIRHFSG